MRIVVYPGSFNPITFGHMNIVDRALGLFDQVIVAFGTSVDKEPDVFLTERMELCRQALSAHGNRIAVEKFSGLLVDFVRAKNTKFVLRGLRTLMDYEYEFQMLEMNRHLDPELEYVLLPTASEWSFVSSTRVREIAALGGDVSEFVHPVVAAFLAKHFHTSSQAS